MSAARAARLSLSLERPVGGRDRFLQPNQVLVLGFAVAILVGTALLSLPAAAASGQRVALVDALFTAVSAVCVTGLTVVTTATEWSTFGQTVIMIMIQVGGLGIMTMSTLVALLFGKRITLPERLTIQAALGHIELAGVVRLTRYIILTAILLEVLGAAVLAAGLARDMPLGQAIYMGVFHSISAFNNAGFDLFGNSLESFRNDGLVVSVIMVLFIIGGLGFTVLVDLGRFVRQRLVRRPAGLSLQTKVVLSLTSFLLLFTTVLFFIWEWANPASLGGVSIGGKILNALFMSATPRTAGFNTLPIGELREATLFFFILLMFVGASPGSTGGGIKTTTFGIVVMSVLATLRGRDEVEVFRRRVSAEATRRAVAIVAIALFTVTTVILLLEFTEGGPILPLMFEAMSAFGTVGLSMGITPDLSTWGKVIISLTMFVGRLGPLTLAVALAQAQRTVRPVRFPEEKIMIG